MSQRLRGLLHDSAEVTGVSEFAESAMRSGRRLRRRRTVMLGVAVVAATALLGAGYAALAPGQTTVYVPAATDPLAPWQLLPRTMTFTDDYMYTIFKESAEEHHTVQLPVDADFKDVGGWEVSPDGTGISMVDDDGLRIGEVSEEIPPLRYEAEWLCGAQTWAPDSTEIMVADCAEQDIDLVFVSTRTGKELRRIRDVGDLGSAIYTGDGKHVVWGNPTDGYTIAEPDGAKAESLDVGTVPEDARKIWPDIAANGEHAFSRAVTSVSFDGRYVCHDVVDSKDKADTRTVSPDDGGDAAVFAMNSASSGLDCDYMIDTTTGEPVVVDGGTLDGAAFGPNGEMLLGVMIDDEQNYEVRLLNEEGELIDSREVRSDLAGQSESGLGSYL